MNHPILLDDLATQEALGILPDDDRKQLRELLASADASSRDEASRFGDAAALLAESLEPVAPPPFVKANILRAVAGIPTQSRTIRAGEGRWYEQPIPGIEVKPLSVDKERGIATILMKFAPGAVYPAHPHRGAEESYVISGSCRIGAIALREGDFHHADAGSVHGDVVSDEGCVLLLVVDEDDYIAA
jgi:anti-sigma factor ChrR (cupin superfamily)